MPALCGAEELPDPTRPPAVMVVPASGVAVPHAPAGLQSIIISRNRRAAIIGGETVELGGKHGDAKLIEVNEGHVVLRGAQGRQVLTLFPDVSMTAASGKTADEEPNVNAKPQSPKTMKQPGYQKAGEAMREEKK